MVGKYFDVVVRRIVGILEVRLGSPAQVGWLIVTSRLKEAILSKCIANGSLPLGLGLCFCFWIPLGGGGCYGLFELAED